jgi:hypothetical protein
MTLEVIPDTRVVRRPLSRAPTARGGSKLKAQRSAITNGKLLPGNIDQRSPWVRRCKDLIEQHTADLGGESNTTAAERSLVRRASVLTVELEMLEAKFATNGQASAFDLDLYARTAGGLRRLLETIGLQRRPRDVTENDSALLLYEQALAAEAEAE